MWQRIITPGVTLSGQNQIMVKDLGPEAPSRIRSVLGSVGHASADSVTWLKE